MDSISIDIETYSSESLLTGGVYRYTQATDFEILLFGYSVDGAEPQVVDLASGETIPKEIITALSDPAVTKWAFNALFERTCLSRYLGIYLSPVGWCCSMVWAATLGLPLSLEGVGAVLGLTKQKLAEGKELIKYFCSPCNKASKPTPRQHHHTAVENVYKAALSSVELFEDIKLSLVRILEAVELAAPFIVPETTPFSFNL